MLTMRVVLDGKLYLVLVWKRQNDISLVLYFYDRVKEKKNIKPDID